MISAPGRMRARSGRSAQPAFFSRSPSRIAVRKRSATVESAPLVGGISIPSEASVANGLYNTWQSRMRSLFRAFFSRGVLGSGSLAKVSKGSAEAFSGMGTTSLLVAGGVFSTWSFSSSSESSSLLIPALNIASPRVARSSAKRRRAA
ncbi:hypothetical protein PENSPDRAFT_442551 [Peniophora sp. CONT]|nr:hypothetical protein PENSPDRAFT_442551 [Peniophora sp. CONT]